MDVEKQCMIFLKYLGSQETLKEVGINFGVTPSTVHAVIRRILNCVIPAMSSELIKWPSESEATEISSKFANLSFFPEAILGAIDCRETPIEVPSENKASYFNRKSFYSVKLQAIVDCDYKFIDVFVGWPGRSHDARCFVNSPIYERLESNEAYLNGRIILGDSAYPCRNYLMTPFKGNVTPQKHLYNKHLSKCRQVSFFFSNKLTSIINFISHILHFQVVECAFGQLSERWRRMKFVHLNSLEDMVKVIIAACTMHNFCKQFNDLPFPTIETMDDENEESQLETSYVEPSVHSGLARREHILASFNL